MISKTKTIYDHQATPTKDRSRNSAHTKEKKVESNTDSAAHNQTLKQQNQINERSHHMLFNTNTEC
jgi:hypothetical protein